MRPARRRAALPATAAAIVAVAVAFDGACRTVASAAQEGGSTGTDVFAPVHAIVGQFGPPRVVVEAGRPERIEDRLAATLILEALSEMGFESVDGETYRASRRRAADEAHARGAWDRDALRALDRVEADCMLRVVATVSSEGSGDAYGVPIERRECLLQPMLVRLADGSTLPLEQVSASASSRSGDLAAEQSRAQAAAAMAQRAAAAVVVWLGRVQSGDEPWILELEGVEGDPRAAMSMLKLSGATVLESEPAGWAAVRVSAAEAARITADGGGPVVLVKRPGYVRIRVDARSAGWSAWGVRIAVALAALGVVGLAIRRRRALPSPGEPPTRDS